MSTFQMQLFACGWASHSNLSVIEFMIDLECMQFNTSMQYSYRIIANGAHVRMYTWYRYGNEYNGDANGTHESTHGIDLEAMK